MRVSFAPQRRDDALNISASGDVLTVNGQQFDFSQLQNGDLLPQEAIASEWFAGPVTRESGEVRVKLIRPHGPYPSAADAFPQDVTL